MEYMEYECPVEDCEVVICDDPTCDCKDHDHEIKQSTEPGKGQQT